MLSLLKIALLRSCLSYSFEVYPMKNAIVWETNSIFISLVLQKVYSQFDLQDRYSVINLTII